MKKPMITMIATIASVLFASLHAAVGQQVAVTQWHANAEALVAGFTGRGNAAQAYTMALIQVAVYDATVAVRGRDAKNQRPYEPFIADVVAPADTNLNAAIATAAFRVGYERVNSDEKARTSYRAVYDTYIAGIPGGQAKTDGVAAGEATAKAVLGARSNDNFYNSAAYISPSLDLGVWQSVSMAVPHATAGANDYAMAFTIPLTVLSPGARRIKPALSSTDAKYRQDFEETKVYGELNSKVRTAEMTGVVQFWTESGFTLWSRNVRDIVTARGLNEFEAARALAAFSVATGDAMLACWDSKYAHRFWRPWQAIRSAGGHDSARTAPDPAWTPTVRANHPEYPAGHGCYAGAGTQVLELLFGDVPVTLTSTGNQVTGHPVVPKAVYRSLAAINDDNANARVWGGLHWRWTMQRSSKWSAQIAKNAVCGQFGLKCDKGRIDHNDY
jgi:hypothetical protein